MRTARDTCRTRIVPAHTNSCSASSGYSPSTTPDCNHPSSTPSFFRLMAEAHNLYPPNVKAHWSRLG